MTAGTNNGALTTTNAPTSRTNLGIGAAALLSSPVTVPNGGTGLTSPTTLGVFVGNGTSALQTPAFSADGQLFVAATGAAPAFASPAPADGSITFSSSAVITATQSSTSQLGATALATALQSTTGTDTTHYLTASTLASRYAKPGAIGGTAPNAGTFTNIRMTTLLTGPTITTGSGAASASAPKGSLFLRTDGTTTNNRAYTNIDGSTTWTAFVTVA